MKVLDPQSAHLPLSELQSYLARHHAQPSPKDKQIGSYPSADLTGLNAVNKDLRTYFADIAPHIPDQAPVDEWMADLVQKLKGYGLMQAEVVQLLNLGVGTKVGVVADDEGESDEGEMASVNETLFRLVVEECDERFPGEQGEARIREILEVLRVGVKKRAEALNGS